jgi:sterol desaturase/sphingolipid hydroxylase (fatty acid hydroxylase superfamily)
MANHLRLVAFLLGLFTFLSWELAAPHHAPSRPRLARWRINFGFAAINGVVVALVCATCLTLADQGAVPWRWGPFQQIPLPLWVRWSLEVVVLDLLVYGLHRAYHRLPWLWRFHAVHHSDGDLDVSSASRFHLGEVVISGVVKVGAVQLLGISAQGLIGFEVLLLLAAQFQHANLRLPGRVEAWLWWVLVPPAMHRVHHHPLRETTDSNYGTLLTVWDRWFRTLRARAPSDHQFGIAGAPDQAHLGALALLRLPFRSRATRRD